jgi:hypothetical protein
MSVLIFYAAFAICFLLLVLVLLTRGRTHESSAGAEQDHGTPDFTEDRWLNLSERIFDPEDARWLREELAFPVLADSLTQLRKQLAIRWLKTLQGAFNEFVRAPEMLADDSPEVDSSQSWRWLWLAVRFQMLIFYALMVVRLFGPYHRLIPSFGWMRYLKPEGLELQPSPLARHIGAH